MTGQFFPELPDEWEPTRATLHAYAQSVMAVNRVAGIAHPKWWHVAFKVRPEGLVTDPIGLPAGGLIGFRMDLRHHVVAIDTDHGHVATWELRAGLTATELAEAIIATVEKMGISGVFPREKFENDEPREYDPALAHNFHLALVNAFQTLEEVRVALDGPVGPVQLWPHGFDLSFEWFGTRVEAHTEADGSVEEYPSQINFGFYPGDGAYFYSNPWPFDEELTSHDLPHGAGWHRQGWQGSIYRYHDLAGDPEAKQKLLDYYRAVWDLAAPGLSA